MHHETTYKSDNRYSNDEKAISDIRDYLGESRFNEFVEHARELAKDGTASGFNSVNFALSFAGIQGYPVHAFGRRYVLIAFRAWMHSDPDPIMTDVYGFRLTT